ncbi:serine protease persephone [Aedes aegypti]|uniref:Uncharacterized protein n=1 Tax=Aedes aegypti TaxID=7159 RepID=A0A6I8TWE3_AEDAE|nr:serine protease persephone [Aedes aegypti]
MQPKRSVRLLPALVVLFCGLLTVFPNLVTAEMYEGDSCKSMKDVPGTCRNPNECPWIQVNVNQKRLYPIKAVPRCGFTVQSVLVCCPNESSIRKADQACRNFARGSTYIAQHIIEGKEADEGEIPFIAALGYSSLDPAKEYDFRCGASWIAKKFLLTAAHCVRKNDRPVVARIGTINLDETDRTRFQDSEVKEIYLHPKYTPKSKYNDIALIELATPFEYDDNSNRVCLYTDTHDLDPDHVLTASGWGVPAKGDVCTLKDGEPGLCQESTSCPWFLENIVKKKRFGERVTCGFDGTTEVICCKMDQPVTFKPGVRSGLACQNIPDADNRLTFHIIDGEDAADGEFPFMAVLGYENEEIKDGYDYRCGASLISPNFLLTAAHCIPRQGRPVVALLGTASLNSMNGVTVKIKEFYPHPEYRASRSYNDIALVELEKRLLNEPDVNPICVRSDTEDLSSDVVLTAEGFGIIDVDKQMRSPQMMKVNLTTVALSKCNESFAANNLLTNNRRLPQGIIDTQYCATGRENIITKQVGDTCQGDSGGPLQIVVDGKFQLVGVTSFGNGCGSNTPSVYTRVAKYIDWIEQIVWPTGVLKE